MAHSSVNSHLRNQRRVSIISTTIITTLLVIWIMLILYLIECIFTEKKSPEIIAYSVSSVSEEATVEEIVEPEVQVPPPRIPTTATQVITSTLAAEIELPELEVDTSELSLDFTETELDLTWGETTEAEVHSTVIAKANWSTIPRSLKGRCSSKQRLERLKQFGGTPQCETAVLKALDWLSETQNKDGSWAAHHEVGHTALGLLCFLGHCETPASDNYGFTVQNAISYLLDNGIQQNGKLATDLQDKQWPYEHAIATYALAESYLLCREFQIEIPHLADTVRQAAAHIVEHQHATTGAWDYAYATTRKRGGDASLTCWHLQALKACSLTKISGLPDLKKSAHKALRYLSTCQRDNGGVHYLPRPNNGGPDYPTLTGATLLCYQQWGKAHHRTAKRARAFAEKHSDFDYHSSNADLYKHYYYAQALLNIGGSTWKHYNRQFHSTLLENQNPDGSWPTPGGGQKIEGLTTRSYTSDSKSARHYRTCLATLMLEVYYRYLSAQ